MKNLNINLVIRTYTYSELSEADRNLIDAAKEATKQSYAPYSKFYVGAAVRLTNGIVITGSNQENAAYPSGTCAERTALFYANSQYPDQPIETLAVAARTENDFINHPIPPCGACRQVMLEVENRHKHPYRILLYGKDVIYEIGRVGDLLPLSFDAESMK